MWEHQSKGQVQMWIYQTSFGNIWQCVVNILCGTLTSFVFGSQTSSRAKREDLWVPCGASQTLTAPIGKALRLSAHSICCLHGTKPIIQGQALSVHSSVATPSRAYVRHPSAWLIAQVRYDPAGTTMQAMAHVAREMLKKELCQLMKAGRCTKLQEAFGLDTSLISFYMFCDFFLFLFMYCQRAQGPDCSNCAYGILWPPVSEEAERLTFSIGWEQRLLCWLGRWLGATMLLDVQCVAHMCHSCVIFHDHLRATLRNLVQPGARCFLRFLSMWKVVQNGHFEWQDFFKWRVVFEGPQDSLPDLPETSHAMTSQALSLSRYEGGIFSAVLNFPADFPNNPPEMKLDPQNGHLPTYCDRCIQMQMEWFIFCFIFWLTCYGKYSSLLSSLVNAALLNFRAVDVRAEVWNRDVAPKYLSGWTRVHLHPSSSWHRPFQRPGRLKATQTLQRWAVAVRKLLMSDGDPSWESTAS